MVVDRTEGGRADRGVVGPDNDPLDPSDRGTTPRDLEPHPLVLGCTDIGTIGPLSSPPTLEGKVSVRSLRGGPDCPSRITVLNLLSFPLIGRSLGVVRA